MATIERDAFIAKIDAVLAFLRSQMTPEQLKLADESDRKYQERMKPQRCRMSDPRMRKDENR